MITCVQLGKCVCSCVCECECDECAPAYVDHCNEMVRHK